MTHVWVYLWSWYITQVLACEINVSFGRKLWALAVSHCVFIQYFFYIFHFGHWNRDVLIRCQTWPWVSALEEMVLRCMCSANSPPFCFSKLWHSRTASANLTARPRELICQVHTRWQWLPMMDEFTFFSPLSSGAVDCRRNYCCNWFCIFTTSAFPTEPPGSVWK